MRTHTIYVIKNWPRIPQNRNNTHIHSHMRSRPRGNLDGEPTGRAVTLFGIRWPITSVTDRLRLCAVSAMCARFAWSMSSTHTQNRHITAPIVLRSTGNLNATNAQSHTYHIGRRLQRAGVQWTGAHTCITWIGRRFSEKRFNGGVCHLEHCSRLWSCWK